MQEPEISDQEINMFDFVQHIHKYIKSEIKTIFEIGSLNGQDAFYLKQNFPFAEVYAIEGLESNYNLFLKDLQSIHTFNTIISNVNGFTKWHEKNVNGIHSIFDRGESFGTEVSYQKCETLETFCNNLNIKSIDVMKVDVEGATLEVLVGCGELLKNIKIIHLESESEELFKGQKCFPILDKFMRKNNFTLLKRTQAEITDTAYQYDCIYINNNL